jgi:hypothetical protein
MINALLFLLFSGVATYSRDVLVMLLPILEQ